MNWCTLILS